MQLQEDLVNKAGNKLSTHLNYEDKKQDLLEDMKKNSLNEFNDKLVAFLLCSSLLRSK